MAKRPFEQILAGTAADGRLIFEPIPPATLQQIRAAGLDEAGNRLTVRTDTEGGNPLRCCLRESAAGEQVLLVAYTPPGTRGAYAERGPVFVHAEPCGGYLTPGRYPPALSHRQQVARAYDRDGKIAGGVLVNGGEHAVAVIGELLARPGVRAAVWPDRSSATGGPLPPSGYPDACRIRRGVCAKSGKFARYRSSVHETSQSRRAMKARHDLEAALR